MTRNELYELEGKVVQNIDRIKAEQAEYIRGVEKGIELMFRAVRDALALIKQQDEQIFQLENRLKECENGYAGTLHIESCKLHDAEERVKELTEENEMLRLLNKDNGLAVVDYAVDSIRAMEFNTVRRMKEALKVRIIGCYLDEGEMNVIIDEVAEKLLNKTEEEKK